MAGTGIFNYIREAFKVPYNLILLGGGLAAGLILRQPEAVWPMVAALEILYLLGIAQHPRFQNLVNSRHAAAEATVAAAQAGDRLLAAFTIPSRRREIEESLQRVQADLGKPDLSETMRTALTESADVLKKRLENLGNADENLQNLRARLLRMENSILLIQEKALTRSDPSFIESEVQAATAGLDTSEEMLRMMDIPALDAVAGGPTPEFLAGGRGRERG